MTDQQKKDIADEAILLYQGWQTDPNLIREQIQYSEKYRGSKIFFTNDEVFAIVNEAIASIQ